LTGLLHQGESLKPGKRPGGVAVPLALSLACSLARPRNPNPLAGSPGGGAVGAPLPGKRPGNTLDKSGQRVYNLKNEDCTPRYSLTACRLWVCVRGVVLGGRPSGDCLFMHAQMNSKPPGRGYRTRRKLRRCYR